MTQLMSHKPQSFLSLSLKSLLLLLFSRLMMSSFFLPRVSPGKAEGGSFPSNPPPSPPQFYYYLLIYIFFFEVRANLHHLVRDLRFSFANIFLSELMLIIINEDCYVTEINLKKGGENLI